MNLNITIDWRTFAVIGVTTVSVLLINNMDSSAIERLSNHIVDVTKEYAIGINKNYRN